jgi:hypothetical protein
MAERRGRRLSPQLRDFLARHGEQRAVEVRVRIRDGVRPGDAPEVERLLGSIDQDTVKKTISLSPREIVRLGNSPIVEAIELAGVPVILDRSR